MLGCSIDSKNFLRVSGLVSVGSLILIKSFLVFLDRIPEYPRTHINEIEPDSECLLQLQLI